MMTLRALTLTLPIAALLGGVALQAQPVPPVPTPTLLTVTAEGRVERAPDVATVSGGVISVAATASAAMADNATRMTRVVAAIRKAGVAERDVQTTGLSLQPQYRYENNQPPVLTGYQATNTVSIRIRDLAQTGRLLDTLVGVGANQLNGPNFSIDKADAALDGARADAVALARSRAELYARAAGLHVRRIVNISESGGEGPQPMPKMYATRMAAAPESPVASGEVSLSVNVTMTFELE